MKTATIVLDGQEYTVEELKGRKTSAWLKKAEGPLMEAVQIIVQAQDMDTANLDEVGALISTAARVLIGSVETIIELLIEFAPELKEQIEEAYTSELVDAFVEVVKLAFPFTSLLAKLGELRNLGSPDEETGTSSHSPNGASGPMSSTTT